MLLPSFHGETRPERCRIFRRFPADAGGCGTYKFDPARTGWCLRAAAPGPCLIFPQRACLGQAPARKNGAALITGCSSEARRTEDVVPWCGYWRGCTAGRDTCESSTVRASIEPILSQQGCCTQHHCCGGNGHRPVGLTPLLRVARTLPPPAASRLPRRRGGAAETAASSDTRGSSGPPTASANRAQH